jgi:hypothetical protein
MCMITVPALTVPGLDAQRHLVVIAPAQLAEGGE